MPRRVEVNDDDLRRHHTSGLLDHEDGTELDFREVRPGELQVLAYLDGEDLCASPNAKNTMILSVRKHKGS